MMFAFHVYQIYIVKMKVYVYIKIAYSMYAKVTLHMNHATSFPFKP